MASLREQFANAAKNLSTQQEQVVQGEVVHEVFHEVNTTPAQAPRKPMTVPQTVALANVPKPGTLAEKSDVAEKVRSLNPNLEGAVSEINEYTMRTDLNEFILRTPEHPDGVTLREFVGVILAGRICYTLFNKTTQKMYKTYDRITSTNGIPWDDILSSNQGFQAQFRYEMDLVLPEQAGPETVVTFLTSGTAFYRMKEYVKKLAVEKELGTSQVFTHFAMSKESGEKGTFYAPVFTFFGTIQ